MDPPLPPPLPASKKKQNRSPKTTAQARPYFFPKQRACSLDTTFRLAIPVFLTLTDVIEFITGIKVARYSFSRSIPPKFERKLRRHKQGFGKIDTTVVLDKDENWL